jgi:alpha-mannosidase
MPKKKIHLISNAHLDPVWLWEWEEGASEALSTFRTVASCCEEFDDFIFNHNESILYRWVEEYEPALFKKLHKLVREKKWHIMGGWFLQPDCNMPSGESFVRQILLGKKYFKEKFGVEARTAVNLDPFGHSRGLAQILAKSGYDSYLFCRPSQAECPLSSDEFIWVGHDGSEIIAARASAHYNSLLGKARSKVEDWMKNNPEKDLSILLWGVGNHGGGPSRHDLKDLAKLMKETKDFSIIHSIPEDYFKELKRKKSNLPRRSKDLNPWAIGCYTSMTRVKQKHRQLENEIYSAEKMASVASFQGLMKYPQAEFQGSILDLAFSEFHDILPGSSFQPGEEGALRLLDHGLEVCSRIKARAFFVLASGQPKAKEGEIPILVYNPHPYRVKGIIECEFEQQEPNWSTGFLLPKVYKNGKPLSTQVEKELSNLNIEWRKRIAFQAILEPSQMNRFDCRLKLVPAKTKPSLQESNGKILFKTQDLEVVINASTGLIDRYRVNLGGGTASRSPFQRATEEAFPIGSPDDRFPAASHGAYSPIVKGVDFLDKNAFQPIVIEDNADPWGMKVTSFRKLIGKFALMSKEDGSHFSGITANPIPSVRVIENGEVRTVVESMLSYGHSYICQKYKLPKEGTEIELELRVFWNEKDKMLKLSIPTLLASSTYIGQVAYGVDELPSNGNEVVAQKWVAVVSHKKNLALTFINEGVYGSDFCDKELRISLLRSPAYSADPIEGRPMIAQDRFVPRQDQGERTFRFWINAQRAKERLENVDREALVRNERPFVLSFFPAGTGKKPKPGVILSDKAIQVTAFKKAEESSDLIIRLFEPTGKKRTTVLLLPWVSVQKKITLSSFEIKTLKFNPKTKKFQEVNLLEKNKNQFNSLQ